MLRFLFRTAFFLCLVTPHTFSASQQLVTPDQQRNPPILFGGTTSHKHQEANHQQRQNSSAYLNALPRAEFHNFAQHLVGVLSKNKKDRSALAKQMIQLHLKTQTAEAQLKTILTVITHMGDQVTKQAQLLQKKSTFDFTRSASFWLLLSATVIALIISSICCFFLYKQRHLRQGRKEPQPTLSQAKHELQVAHAYYLAEDFDRSRQILEKILAIGTRDDKIRAVSLIKKLPK